MLRGIALVGSLQLLGELLLALAGMLVLMAE
jgi:hypothetical protein